MVRARSTREPTRDHERGQLVLISAITIAFILLGVVVVFNGVLYTQTLSSSASGQTVSDAERTAAEVTQGVLTVTEHREAVVVHPDDSGPLLDDVNSFLDQYQNQTAANRPAIVSSNVSTVNGTYATANLSAERNVSNADIYGVALTLESVDLNDSENVTVELNGSPDVTISENNGTLEIERGDDRCEIELDGEPATIDFVTGTVHGAERTTCSASRLPPASADLVVAPSENMSGVQLEVLFAEGSAPADWEDDEDAVVAIEIDLEYTTNDLTQSRTLEVPMPLGVSDS
ncbi:DUF7261 family protein [Natronosalvus halobius]|uniref:DUF7261 family protein n=1 Tax=Natronosalvus halobius TaxID=2953746 RepID=UPI0020A0FEF2|nr:hypothetical protein [Natronosalvus halobius]USZ70727.1 hypothetical protein NGM15_11505 [Natronosalvus halobius]